MIGKKSKIAIASLGLALGGGAVVGSAFGGPGISSASSAKVVAVASQETTDTTVAADAATDDATDDAADVARPAETPLEGDVAAKVTEAAQAAVPGGTIDRVETDNDGVYEAHATTADGNEVIVQVGADFVVTATVEGHGGHGGRGHGDEAPLEGDVAAKVTEAAQAAVPGGTVDRVETDSDGSPYEAHVTNADGTEVVVKIDDSFAVTATQDMPARGEGGRGGHGHGGKHAHDDAAADGATAETENTTAG